MGQIKQYAEATVTGPCGHEVDFFESVIETDEFKCPRCGLRWGVDQDPPTVSENGFVMPGDRKVVVRQGEEELAVSRSMYPSRSGAFRKATAGDWQCRRCGRVAKEKEFERMLESIGYRWPLCDCATQGCADWRKLGDRDIFYVQSDSSDLSD